MMFRWSLVPLRVAAVGFALAASTLLSGHVQAQESAPSTLRVFHLKNASADDAGQLVVQVLGDSLRMAVDERTNSLIVQGGDESLQQMEQLLMELDSQPAKAAPPSATQLPPVQVRIFWLLSEGANGAPPEGRFADLKYLEPVRDYRARHASTMLTFDAVVDAISQIEKKRAAEMKAAE